MSDPVPTRWILCGGMPKCGTSTVADLLRQHPAVAVHNQKEPGDWGVAPRTGPLPQSGYRVTSRTKYLADCTTTYWSAGERTRVLSNLEARGAAIDAMCIICVRDPHSYVESFVGHVVNRRGMSESDDFDAIKSEVDRSYDISGALEDLSSSLSPARIFVVRLPDLADPGAQPILFDELCGWLEIPPLEGRGLVHSNSRDSARRYPRRLDRLATTVRSAAVVRAMPPWMRRWFSRALSKPVEARPPRLTDRFVAGKPLAQARLVNLLRSGPLSQQREVMDFLRDA